MITIIGQLLWGEGMANSGDVDRAAKGRDAWNEWAQQQLKEGKAPVADFTEHQAADLGFDGFIFPGPVDFTRANFTGQVTFRRAEFFQTVSFKRANFQRLASFSDAIFRADVAIDRAKFHGDADFNNAQFKATAYIAHTEFLSFANFTHARFERLDITGTEFTLESNFEYAWFNHSQFTGVEFKHALTKLTGTSFEHVPDFRAATFATAPLFQGVKVGYAKYTGPNFCRRWASCAAGEDDAARFRRLKQLAADWRDHERELEFFAKELRAKRFHETKGCLAIALNCAYGFLSDFGQSVWRPSIELLVLTGLALCLILLRYPPVTGERFLAALLLSFSDWALLLGADKWEIRHDAFAKLCGDGCAFDLCAGVLAYVQSAVSLFLLFLLGLGLRNRFRTGST